MIYSWDILDFRGNLRDIFGRHWDLEGRCLRFFDVKSWKWWDIRWNFFMRWLFSSAKMWFLGQPFYMDTGMLNDWSHSNYREIMGHFHILPINMVKMWLGNCISTISPTTWVSQRVARGVCFNGHPGKSLMKHGFFGVSTTFSTNKQTLVVLQFLVLTLR